MTTVTASVHPVHLMNADWALDGRQPSDQANQLGLWVGRWMAAGIHIHHHHLLLLLSPKADIHFTITTEGGRLSRPRHCRKGARPVPKAVHRSGCRDKHNWPRPLTPQSIMSSQTTATCWDTWVWTTSLRLLLDSAAAGIELATIELQVQRPNHRLPSQVG